jgi:hypothetical protein
MRKQSNIFPHRKNQDGSWDTICTVCFGTVATRSHESALAQEEEVHICPHLTRPEIVLAPGPIQKIFLHPRWRTASEPDNDEM